MLEDENGYVESSSSGSEFEANSSDESESEAEKMTEEEEDLDDIHNSGFIEHQIEGDFDRLIGSIQDADDVASSATLSKIWDTPGSEEAEEQFQADLRAASGIGRARRGKGKGRSRRTGPVLSHQVRALIGEGNAAYVDGNLQEAVRIMTEVIRIEPRAVSAWSVLATCYRELNEPTKALQISIMGAHLRHDPEEWHELARQSRDAGYLQQALYCLTKTMRLDPTNFGAIWDRASLSREVGDFTAARSAYLLLLKHFPHDTALLAELRYILIETGDLKLCAKLYQDAFDHFMSMYPEGKMPGAGSNVIDPLLADNRESVPDTAQPPVGEFTFMDILVLGDLYNSLGWYDRTIRTIRTGCRWLQGRSKQKYWDTCPDDREYDVEGTVRDDNDDSLSIKQGFYPLDVNARHRLAIARLRLGDTDEGRMHAGIILSEEIADFAPLFTEIADTFFERAMYSEARPIYEMLGSDATTSSVHVLMQVADCRRNVGETSNAAEIYEHIINADPTNDDARMKLAEIHEANGHTRKALELVYRVIDARKKKAGTIQEGTPQEEEETVSMPLFSERKRGRGGRADLAKARRAMSRQQLLELERRKEEETAEWYGRLQELQDPMRSGDKEAALEWLANAEKLIEMFRETRSLFVTRSARPFRGTILTRRTRKEDDEQEMASRLELELEHEKEERESRRAERREKGEVVHFRGIHFDDWLSLAMEYAFVLARQGQFDVAEDAIRHLMYSTVYSKQKYQDTLRLTMATCAVQARRFDVVLEMFRRLMLNHQFNNELIRLFLASIASGLAQTDQVIETSLQKFVLRELRTHANALEGKAHWIVDKRRFMTGQPAGGKHDVEDEDDIIGGEVAEPSKESDSGGCARPTRSNPVLPTLYGQSLMLAKSYQSALFYLLHAYDYFANDPLICMSLAVASLGRAMQRQSDNRNFLITQALGFMTKYRFLRGPRETDPHADEIEYNFGRAFHQIGLLSHAVKHYERALRIVERRQASNENNAGVSREAAYNLCLIYVTTGATPLAKEVARRWLAI